MKEEKENQRGDVYCFLKEREWSGRLLKKTLSDLQITSQQVIWVIQSKDSSPTMKRASAKSPQSGSGLDGLWGTLKET